MLLGIYCKLEIYIIRFCLVIQIIRWLYGECGKDQVDTETVQRAILLTEYFKQTATRVQNLMNETALTVQQQSILFQLPELFTTAQGIEVVACQGMKERAFKEFRSLHSIELKSSKVVIALVSLTVALLSSVCYNLYQFSANSRLSDNDIKFRYIKIFGEITSENLLKLETIFEYKREKQKQHSIRRMVEEHEQRVEQRARELEQARLKETQAEQLRQEADKIKQKK